jgi:hypothetical protein
MAELGKKMLPYGSTGRKFVLIQTIDQDPAAQLGGAILFWIPSKAVKQCVPWGD